MWRGPLEAIVMFHAAYGQKTLPTAVYAVNLGMCANIFSVCT